MRHHSRDRGRTSWSAVFRLGTHDRSHELLSRLDSDTDLAQKRERVFALLYV